MSSTTESYGDTKSNREIEGSHQDDIPKHDARPPGLIPHQLYGAIRVKGGHAGQIRSPVQFGSLLPMFVK